MSVPELSELDSLRLQVRCMAMGTGAFQRRKDALTRQLGDAYAHLKKWKERYKAEREMFHEAMREMWLAGDMKISFDEFRYQWAARHGWASRPDTESISSPPVPPESR